MAEKSFYNRSFSAIAITLLIAICGTTPAHSQDSYEEYVKQYLTGLKKFKNERDSAFSAMLKQQWETFDVAQGKKPVQKPTPPKPYVVDKTTKPIDFEIKVTPKPTIKPQPDIAVKPATPSPTVKPTNPVVKPTTPVVPATPVVKPTPTVTPKPVTPTPKVEKPVTKPTKPATPTKPTKPDNNPESPIKTAPTSPIIPIKPITPVTVPESKPITQEPVAPAKKPVATEPKPATPKPATPEPSTTKQEKPEIGIESFGTGNCEITFYGTNVKAPLTADMKFTLSNLSENEISGAWDKLSSSDYRKVVNSCLDAKKALNLNDWLYMKMITALSDKWQNNRKNESNMLAMFLLLQSGYKVKVANNGGKLVLLYATPNEVYAVNYLTIDNTMYYILDKPKDDNYSYTTYRGNFGSSQKGVSFNLSSAPNIRNTPAKTVKRCSGSIDLKLSMNKNLIDIYDDFPIVDYSVYFNTPVSRELRRDLIEPLRAFTTGKSEREAAGNLLNFVQKGFDYQTDDQQFGEERPFFVDENLYYPYNDCEDRSMLYSMLVREILGLDVILLEYPNHIATAVNFKTEVKGDYVTVDGKRYTVCDPTCINAQPGVTMPQFRKTNPTALKY